MSNEKYGVCRLRKYSEGAVCGIEKHVERRATISHTNPDIQRARSKENYDLHDEYDNTFKKQIKERFEKCGVKKKRKDAVVLCELLFTASHDFFEKMSTDEIRQYFQKCYDFVSQKYGKENIVSAMVHLDEYTPHLHLCFTPIVKDKEGYKLCANELFGNGGKLSKLQDEVHEQVFKNYGLARGDKDRKAKHVETLDWKIIQLQEKEENLKRQISTMENEHELLKLNKQLKKTQEMLSKMFDTLESNPKLLADYKKAIEELDRRKSQEQQKNEKEI